MRSVAITAGEHAASRWAGSGAASVLGRGLGGLDALAELDKPLYAICEQDCYPCDPSFPKQNAINMRTYLAECGLGLA